MRFSYDVEGAQAQERVELLLRIVEALDKDSRSWVKPLVGLRDCYERLRRVGLELKEPEWNRVLPDDSPPPWEKNC